MAHNITSTDSMFSVRQPTWHGLGAILDDYPTREQAQALAHPWEPVESPIYQRVPGISAEGDLTEQFVEVEGSKIIERSDTGEALGVTNSTLTLVTNNEMWDVAEAVGNIGRGEIRFETAGSLLGGRQVWVLLRLDEPLTVKGDPNGGTLAFFALQNRHDGMGSFRGQAVNTRIVCANTSKAADLEAKQSGYEFTFRHTARVTERVEEAKQVVALWRAGVAEWQTAMEMLVTMPVSDLARDAFLDRVVPMPPEHLLTERVRGNVTEARSQIRTILQSQTCEGVDATAYGLVQAAIEWDQHVRKVKGTDNRSRLESRFRRSMLSTDAFGARVIQYAQEVALV